MPSKARAFVDFRRIKAEVTIAHILSRYGVMDTLKGTGDQRRGPCPIHGGSNKRHFNVNLRKNVWYCFGDCDAGGNAIDLVAALEACSVHEAAMLLAEWFGIVAASPEERGDTSRRRPSGSPSRRHDDQSRRGSSTRRSRRKKSPRRPAGGDHGAQSADGRDNGDADAQQADVTVNSDSGNPPLAFDRLDHLEDDPELFGARGILPDTAAAFGIGYATRGIMRGRIAIPIHDIDGRLVAYVGVEPDDPKAPYRWPRGFRRELELFNAHRAAASHQLSGHGLIVVRDFFEVFACHAAGRDNVVALMGSKLSEAQLALIGRLLDESDPRQLVFAHAADADGDLPWQTIGRLASTGWVRVTPLAELL